MSSDAKGQQAFLKIREVTLGDASIVAMEDFLCPLEGRQHSVTETIFRKYEPPNWDLARLRTYVDMLRAFGFNSIQLYDQWESYVDAGWGIDSTGWPKVSDDGWKVEPRDWAQKVDAVADYAHTKGLRTTLFVWGNTGFDFRTNEIFWRLCPNVRAEREVLERHWDHQAAHAPHFDHFITHWGDPGGCNRNGCTIETAQHLHNEIVERFRTHNPEIESTFSLWMLDSPRFGIWPGYEGPKTVLDSGILPDDVMVCVHGEPDKLDFDQVREIVRAGRKAGVWGWYTADNEIYPSLHVRTSALKKHFSSLPGEAHEMLSWYSIDSNNHGLNLHNLYVAAELMRDPKADVERTVGEFITGAFGGENVERVRKLFSAIETIRPMWPNTYGDSPPDVKLAREAHSLARDITIPDGFQPAFPVTLSPRELADELLAQTEVIVEFAEFSAAAADVNKLKEQGASAERLAAAVAKLPSVKRPTEWMTNLEYCRYLAILDGLKKT